MRGSLNERQRLAVEHGDGPLLVLSGAGTGKTRVLVHRIATLIEHGVAPWEILAVTFTNKAAQEMRERLRQLLGDRVSPMWIGTFHATCARLLRRWGEAIDVPRDFQILDTDDQLKVIGKLLKEDGSDEACSPRTLLTRFDRAKNRGEDPTTVHTGQYLDDIVARLYPKYAERLRKEHAVDFNDLLLHVLRLAEHPEVGPRLATQFRHVLVDEFQDTNRVQYRLVMHLAHATRNVTVVGDDDQSIYGWRGAEPRNMFDFERDFPDVTVIRLEQNYRSTSIILDAANAVIARNRERHAKSLWTERGGGDPLGWHEAGDERGEASFIAGEIRKMIDHEDVSPRDVAILYRTHAQSRALEDQLRRFGLHPEIVGGLGFYERKEVKDVVAYLRLLTNPASDISFERVVNTPSRGIGDVTVDKVRVVARERELPLVEAARIAVREGAGGLAGAARKKLAGFVDLLDGLTAVIAAGASVAELVIQVVERSRYREILEADKSEEARGRLGNLAELVTVAADYDDEVGGEGDVLGLLERLALTAPGDDTRDDQPRVRMTTVHAAKGLEFPVVFLAGMEDGLFPSLREREDQDQDAAMEEERRLAYVAMTRAKDRLILSAARTRRTWGEIRMQVVSRFLDDIPPACLPRPSRKPVHVGGGADWRRVTAPTSSTVSSPGRGRAGARPAHRGTSWDEHDQRSYDDDEPSFDLDGDRDRAKVREDRIGPGASVVHGQFGSGRVVDASGQGKDRKLVIDFPEIGQKTVLARFVTVA
ncbi:MAG: UvrD-helicase domain-containing protein [Kofleriaceae bacterium]|nr:UvrD-helicase domain-containing protein [Myxococcales bacterium]MCB9564611.1 UvrD-helicase domain-containing protein [Kofleriaceae bacterium]